MCGGLEHLKIETRLIDERFASVMGECVIVTLKVHRLHSMWSVMLQPYRECSQSWIGGGRRTSCDCSGTDHWYPTEAEILKLQKNGQFRDELGKIEGLSNLHIDCLLWIDKAKAKDKTYFWMSVWWERLKTKDEESTPLTYTGLIGELEHL